MRIQSNLGSDIAMAFDECIKIPSPYEYVRQSCDRTVRWLERCKRALAEYNSEPDAVNPGQVLFGINQGAVFHDIRIEHMKRIAELDLPGYAIGGLAVGETAEEMYDTIEAVEEHMPKDRRGISWASARRGISSRACGEAWTSSTASCPRETDGHGHLFTWDGIINIKNAKYERDEGPISPGCDCPVCRRYSRAYVRHLFKAEEMLAMRFAVTHNLWFYNDLMRRIRQALDEGSFAAFRERYANILDKRI